jgi:hypothetical protein
VSRPDRSGADQIDVEHQPTDLAVGGSESLAARTTPQVNGLELFALLAIIQLTAAQAGFVAQNR